VHAGELRMAALSRSHHRGAAMASSSVRRCPTRPTPKSFKSSAVKCGRTFYSASTGASALARSLAAALFAGGEFRITEQHALRFGGGEAILGALGDHLAFVFGHGGENVKG
jgi:hypothetical protein